MHLQKSILHSTLFQCIYLAFPPGLLEREPGFVDHVTHIHVGEVLAEILVWHPAAKHNLRNKCGTEKYLLFLIVALYITICFEIFVLSYAGFWINFKQAWIFNFLKYYITLNIDKTRAFRTTEICKKCICVKKLPWPNILILHYRKNPTCHVSQPYFSSIFKRTTTAL